MKESATGMGMTGKQTLWRVETPLALPVIVAGIRTAAVEVIASATLAAFIGIGGLGLFVVRGFALYDIPNFMSTIRFEHVSKQFANAQRPSVDDISFQIDEGSFVVLLGPSGCGKTTLLKMINRLVEPTSGAIYLGDENILDMDAITRTGLQDEMIRLQHRLKKTIVFVTHDVEEALHLADKIVIMREGEIVQYDTPFRILSHPADQFVRDLVGADDIVRQLSLIRVESAMAPLPPDFVINGYPPIVCHADLRTALSVLLRTHTTALTVMDDETPVGLLTLQSIQSVAAEG